MLNKSENFLLNLIVEKSKSGYAIFEINDILLSYPKSYLVDAENVVEYFKVLSNANFIKVKYSDGENFCAIATEKGVDYSEFFSKQIENNYKNNDNAFGFSLLGGIFGGFIGALTAFLIALLSGGAI